MGEVIETVADSIAIEFLDKNSLIIGRGNELHLYCKNAATGNVLHTKSLSIKLTNKIHGIKKSQLACDNILLVHGEKEFVLIEYEDDFIFKEIYRAELSDWISCALFLNEPKELVILTAHSILLRFLYRSAKGSCTLKERISCTDKSTLYCAHLFGDKWNELTVFGGNAFGELLIWLPSKNAENPKEPLKPKVSSLIHRIAAHNGVIFSIDYDKNTQCLITTSDDRAIKWWQIQFNEPKSWEHSNLLPLSSGYGHIARVFQGRLVNEGPNIYALTAGEDSYFCLWNKNSELLFKRRHQYGAIIWNFVYDNEIKTIYTIGSTGNLIAFDLNGIFNKTQNIPNDILLPAIADEASIQYIAKVKFLSENNLIAVTNKNKLVISTLIGQEWQNWEALKIKVDFKCTVMEVFQNIVAVCGYKRLILLEQQENKSKEFAILIDEDILQGVIRTFVFFNKQQYLICDDQGNCLIFTNGAETKRYLQLPKSKEPWLTTALLLNQQKHIVLSNRQGNLLLYQHEQGTENYELTNIIKHPHGNLGATHLLVKESSTSAILKSYGHDGAVNVFSLDFINNRMEKCTRQSIQVAWVECVNNCFKEHELFLGFNDNHFVAWCKNSAFLLQIPCGGGHRCWSYSINPTTEFISLVFVKNKRVCFYKMPLFNKGLIASPKAKRWHVAPCNVMEILPPSSACFPYIAVTAGDDNLTKIHSFSKQTGLKEHKELQNHISNIRCLKLTRINVNEFLIFSGGGRAQLCVAKVNINNFHLNELVNYTLKAETNNKFSEKPYNIDPETRLMSLDVKVLNQDEYEVFVGCSDGFIRRLKLNVNRIEIVLLSQYFYGKCILQIRYLAESNLVLTAATDGFLNFFDGTLLKCLSQLKHHSSGVNGLSVFYNNTKKCLHILSGGDDQAVSYTEISLNNLDFQIIKQFHKSHLHTAQVCACALSSEGLYGFSSGVDQVLNKIDLSTGDVVASFSSCVADIKGVALIDDHVCLLYGCGLQIYAFNS